MRNKSQKGERELKFKIYVIDRSGPGGPMGDSNLELRLGLVLNGNNLLELETGPVPMGTAQNRLKLASSRWFPILLHTLRSGSGRFPNLLHTLNHKFQSLYTFVWYS